MSYLSSPHCQTFCWQTENPSQRVAESVISVMLCHQQAQRMCSEVQNRRQWICQDPNFVYKSVGVNVLLFKELKALSEEHIPVLCWMWGLLFVWVCHLEAELVSCIPVQQKPCCMSLIKDGLQLSSVSPPELRGIFSVWSAIREVNSSLLRHTVLWFHYKRST